MAEQHLADHGEFYPFAAAVTKTGETSLVSAYWGDEHPASGEVIKRLTTALRQDAENGAYRAVAICFDGTTRDTQTGEKGDAIFVNLDHVDGTATQEALPYERRSDGTYQFDDLLRIPLEPFVFDAVQDDE